jgi:hypothetical protein
MNNSTTNPASQQTNYEVISYLQLRQFIGIIGFLLPFILTGGALLFGRCSELQPSISHYYYSIMHIVFVCTLCVLGGFLITYKGKTNFENTVSNIAGVFAFGVAIFPTAFDGFNGGGSDCQFIQLTTVSPIPPVIGYLHFGFAALLFGCFVIFCMRIFQESDLGIIDQKKIRRNKIYKTCGIIIIFSIVAMAGITICRRITHQAIFPYYIFTFETTSLLAFGFSWLLKGSVNWPHAKSTVKRKAIQYFR